MEVAQTWCKYIIYIEKQTHRNMDMIPRGFLEQITNCMNGDWQKATELYEMLRWYCNFQQN